MGFFDILKKFSVAHDYLTGKLKTNAIDAVTMIKTNLISGDRLTAAARKRVVCVLIPAIGAGTEDEIPVFTAPVDCTIKNVGIVPENAITGADTNYMTLAFVNKGSDGTGTSSMGSVDFTAGEDVAAFDYKDFGDLTNTGLDAGDTVTIKKSEAGTGMDMPRLLAVIQYEVTD